MRAERRIMSEKNCYYNQALAMHGDVYVIESEETKIKQQEEFNKDLDYVRPKHSLAKNLRDNLRAVEPLGVVRSVFPILEWLPKYSLRNDLACDLVSGITVAVMQIPQGIGYALLGNVPPIVGIYMAFFPVLMYFIFGTSRHNSMGVMAVVCLMVGKSVLRLTAPPEGALAASNSTGGFILSETGAPPTPLMVATALCFIVGVWQIFMYVLRLGVASSLLSETLVSGFTTGVAVQVMASQFKDVLGIRLKPITGYYEVILTCTQIYQKLSHTNLVAVLISVIAIIILVANNEVLKPIIARRTSLPVPIELIAVVIGTGCSMLFDWHGSYGIKTIGTIPVGFPAPSLPPFSLMRELILDGFVIAIVSYSITVSMALIFAQKYNYEVGFNQELLAMGAGNLFGSFFSCMPSAASLSRSYVQADVGGKTQVASVVSCALLSFVLLWIAPFFEPLPKCIIASIIIVSLKGLLLQVKQCYQFWKMSKLDAVLWIGTFLAVVVVSLDIGLLVGILLSISCIFLRGMRPYACLLGKVPNTDLFLDISRYKTAIELEHIKIFHFSGCLNFCSRSIFKGDLFKMLDLGDATHGSRQEIIQRFQFLVVDFSGLTYVDPSGVMFLKGLVNELKDMQIAVLFAGTPCPCYETMKKCGLFSLGNDAIKFFPSIPDAVKYAEKSLEPKSVDCI